MEQSATASIVLFLLLVSGFGCCWAEASAAPPPPPPASTSCTVDGVTYPDGSVWPTLDGCQQCRCSTGLAFCVRVSFCRDLAQCGVIITPPGACCPVCFGCVSPSGKKMALNETWMEDDCTSCVCRDGQTKCQASFCRTPCLHPRIVPGECCPVCDDNDDCPLQCLYGRLADSVTGNELCQCRKLPEEDFHDLQSVTNNNSGNKKTIRLHQETSASSSSSINSAINQEDDEEDDENHQDFVTASGGGCHKVPCKRMCPHGFQTDRRGCPVCKCQRCKSIQPCHKKCPLGLIHDGRGCPTCQCRSSTTTTTFAPPPLIVVSHCTTTGNVTYSLGEHWQMDDCTRCVCHQGGPTCAEMTCPILQDCPAPAILFVPGQCCPVCSSSGGGGSRTSATDDDDDLDRRDEDEPTGGMSGDGSALLTAVLVCVSLVAGLILVVAVLAFCVARQCQRLQLQEESMAAAAAVKLTAVNRLRPKSTNLDYQYNIYLHRYRENDPSCWAPLNETSESSRDKDEGASSSQCSNSPLLVNKSAAA